MMQQQTWSGAFPIILGLAAVAFAANSICKNQDKRRTEYQISIAAAFVGILCVFCGMMMMGSGLGIGLFTGGASRAGLGYGGGGYGMW